ncbi:MAG: alpha/beta hydrolase [Sumerlaeia bacterium]
MGYAATQVIPDETRGRSPRARFPQYADSFGWLAFPPSRTLPFKKTRGRTLLIHVFLPPRWKASDRRPAIVYLHGGSWVVGTPSQFFPQAFHFAQLGMVTACPEYRLWGRDRATPFAGVRDSRSAIRWLRENAANLGVDPTRVIVAGGSAGGHLAACASVIPEEQAPNEAEARDCAPPAAMILYNPVLDLRSQAWKATFTRELFGPVSRVIWSAYDPVARQLSPHSYLRPGLPPALIIHGEDDRVVPHIQSRRFTEDSSAAGNDCQLISYPHSGHAFHNYGFHPTNRPFHECLRHVEDFLGERGLLAEEPCPMLSVDESA